MAVDPATMKIIAQAAAKVATDEETRKKLLIIILAPVIGVILLISLFYYLITHPLEALKVLLSEDEAGIVENYQSEYTYDDQYGIYEAPVTETNNHLKNRTDESMFLYLSKKDAASVFDPVFSGLELKPRKVSGSFNLKKFVIEDMKRYVSCTCFCVERLAIEEIFRRSFGVFTTCVH